MALKTLGRKFLHAAIGLMGLDRLEKLERRAEPSMEWTPGHLRIMYSKYNKLMLEYIEDSLKEYRGESHAPHRHDDLPQCVNCRVYVRGSSRMKTGLCGACYNYPSRSNSGGDRPLELQMQCAAREAEKAALGEDNGAFYAAVAKELLEYDPNLEEVDTAEIIEWVKEQWGSFQDYVTSIWSKYGLSFEDRVITSHNQGGAAASDPRQKIDPFDLQGTINEHAGWLEHLLCKENGGRAESFKLHILKLFRGLETRQNNLAFAIIDADFGKGGAKYAAERARCRICHVLKANAAGLRRLEDATVLGAGEARRIAEKGYKKDSA